MNLLTSRCLFLLCASMLLSGCGFKLAGTDNLPLNLSSIQLITDGMTNRQRQALELRLTRAGAELVTRAGTDAVLLAVSYKVLPDRRLVTSASNNKSVDRLSRSLDFSVKSATGEVLAPVTTLVQQKDAQLDDDNLLASNRERASVIEDLEQALYDQLIRQLKRI